MMKVNGIVVTAAFVVGVSCESSVWAKSIDRDWPLSVAYIENQSTGLSGTGFLVARQVGSNAWESFLVSNKHVLEPKPYNATTKDGFTTNRDAAAKVYLNRSNQDRLVLTNLTVTLRDQNTEYVIGHPRAEVDVAALDFTRYLSYSGPAGNHLDGGFIREEQFLTREKMQSEYVTIGDRVLVLGYPLSIVDQSHVSPIGRSGCIASLPELDFRGMPIVLIAAVFLRGSSGSPVLEERRRRSS
jgi:hypothetical protein